MKFFTPIIGLLFSGTALLASPTLQTAYDALETNAVAALPLFQAIVNKQPQSVEALLGLGQSLLADQQNIAAETAFRNALLHAETPDMKRAAQIGLVHCFVAMKRYAEAETVLEELIAAHPEEAVLRRIQGQVRLAQGNAMGARVSYEVARRLGDESEKPSLSTNNKFNRETREIRENQ